MKVNDVDFRGNGSSGGLPYNLAPGTQDGDAVTLVSAGTMGRGSSGQPFEGVVIKVEKDGKGTVAKEGIVHPQCVAGLAVGRKSLVVNGAGKVTSVNDGSGRSVLVVVVQGTDTAVDLN